MRNKVLALILLLPIISINVYGQPMEDNMYMETGIVVEEEMGEELGDIDSFINQIQYVKVKIITGKFKGEIIEIENALSGNSAYDIIAKKGDKLVIGIEEDIYGNVEAYVSDYVRQNQILYLLGIFILLLIIIGRGKGVKAVITLSFTVLMIIKVLLPLLLKGINPIPISILISIVVTLVTIFIISGVNSKSISAIIGTSSGVIIAGLLAYFIGGQVKLTGLHAEEATMLMYIPQGINFNFKGLLFSGIILGALGAIMDVGMSIASSIEEIHNANNALTRKELFNAGMNVGKDIMGTMTNTLILAYAGSSIPMLLLFMAYETSMVKIINLDIIATEIVRSLSGSIGIVLTIPLTALISTVLIKRTQGKGSEE